MARTFDVNVVVAPALRAAFEGRKEINLGVPASSGVGEVLESLFKLYPRARALLVNDRRATGRYMHVAVDEHAMRELAHGGGGLAAGQRVYLFALSRRPAGNQPGREG